MFKAVFCLAFDEKSRKKYSTFLSGRWKSQWVFHLRSVKLRILSLSANRKTHLPRLHNYWVEIFSTGQNIRLYFLHLAVFSSLWGSLGIYVPATSRASVALTRPESQLLSNYTFSRDFKLYFTHTFLALEVTIVISKRRFRPKNRIRGHSSRNFGPHNTVK